VRGPSRYKTVSKKLFFLCGGGEPHPGGEEEDGIDVKRGRFSGETTIIHPGDLLVEGEVV